MVGWDQYYTYIHTTTHALAWSATHYQYTTWLLPNHYLSIMDTKWGPNRGAYGVFWGPK